MSRDEMRRLAQQSIERGDATGWFEELYQSASGSWDRVPWADLVANPYLLAWLASGAARGGGKRCLVVGCGLGDDAEALSSAGFDVVAFDVARTAIDACRARWAVSRVAYEVADALAPPRSWVGHFDFIFESYTLQVMPPPARAVATAALASLVAPGGRLLVLCRARDRGEAEGQVPWPLLREELDAFVAHGLREVSCESFLDDESPPVRRFRALYQRPDEGR